MRITTKRNYFHAFFLSLLLALVANTTISAPAHAARPFAAPPQIENFYVEPVDQFGPGVELSFTVEGTPGAQARVRIGGSNKNVSLEEVSRGVYEGSYTISRKDRISESSIVRVTLRARGLATSENYRLPPSSGSGPAAAAPAPAPAPQPAALAIERFTVTPIGKIEPGADLKFALNGTPGASASFTIENVVKDVPMREVSRGRYEGSYTIRRLDHFPAAVNILATIEAGGKAVGARLNQSLLTDARPPVVKNVVPQNGETVVADIADSSVTRPLVERSDIVFEFLRIMRRTPALPAPLRPLQGFLIRAAVQTIPAWLRDRIGLGEDWNLAPWQLSVVCHAGDVIDRLILRTNPAVQGCRRLGLPDDYLYSHG